MKVLKFGGSSVGSAQGLRQVRRIVAANNGQIVVVVSALGGITDRLLATAAAAAAGKPDYTDSLAEIVARHRTTIDETVASERRGAIRRRTDELLDELANILRGVYLIRDLAPTGDAIVATANASRRESWPPCSKARGSTTRGSSSARRPTSGKHIAEPDLTEKLIRERLADRPRVSVVPGFIASDCATGDVTNLGRGGSDYTAALIAAALNAETLEIWTDVDGFMTADPRVISDAYVIDRLSFEEAMELCNFGAKVVYPPTIFPVYHRDIPILIKNTFNPRSAGHVHLPRAGYRRDKGDQGDLLDQQHLSGDHSRAGHGRRDRRQPPHLPHTGQGRHQRLLRVAGRLGEHHVDRTAQRGRRSGHRDAHQEFAPKSRSAKWAASPPNTTWRRSPWWATT